MPKMTIPPQTYKNFAAQQVKIKNMKPSQFVQWAHSFYGNAYRDGYDKGFNDAQEKFSQNGINVSEDVDVEILDIDSIRDILLSVRGIGEKRAEEVIGKLVEKGEEQ